MKKLILYTFALCLVAGTSPGQQTFSKEQLRADADLLYNQLIRIHPDPFFRFPKSNFDTEYRLARANLADSMNAVDFYRIMAPVLYRIRDGHTSIDMRSVETGRADNLFPLTVDIDPSDFTMHLRTDFSGESGIPAGAEILRVNGRTPARIVADFLPYVSSERDERKIRYLHYYVDFQALFFLVYGEDRFEIEYRTDGKTGQVDVPIMEIPMPQLLATPSEWFGMPDYTVRYDEELRLAIIGFNRFNNPGKFAAFAEQTFREIQERNITRLIIDIRINGGGSSDIGDEFFQYLSPVSFRQFVKMEIRALPEMKPHLPEEARTLPDYSLYTYDHPLTPLRENPYRFSGSTYLLTSAASYSSAASFPLIFQEYGMGTIVGEESGMPAIAFGNPLPVTLPNTGIRCMVSTGKMFVLDRYGWKGAIPAYEVPAEEALTKALELIRESEPAEIIH